MGFAPNLSATATCFSWKEKKAVAAELRPRMVYRRRQTFQQQRQGKGADVNGRCLEDGFQRQGNTGASNKQGEVRNIGGPGPQRADPGSVKTWVHLPAQVGKKRLSENQNGQSCCKSSKTSSTIRTAPWYSKCCCAMQEQARITEARQSNSQPRWFRAE